MDRLFAQHTKAGIDIDALTEEPVPLNLTALRSAAQPQPTGRPGCAFGAGFRVGQKLVTHEIAPPGRRPYLSVLEACQTRQCHTMQFRARPGHNRRFRRPQPGAGHSEGRLTRYTVLLAS